MFICFHRSLQKLPQLVMFQTRRAGYWVQFSTSNNSTSLFDHWLLYRHCAKLTRNLPYLALTRKGRKINLQRIFLKNLYPLRGQSFNGKTQIQIGITKVVTIAPPARIFAAKYLMQRPPVTQSFTEQRAQASNVFIQSEQTTIS